MICSLGNQIGSKNDYANASVKICMATSLQEYEKITECADLPEGISMTNKEALQRMDIFLYSQRIQEDSSSEMLVIELKAPHAKRNGSRPPGCI